MHVTSNKGFTLVELVVGIVVFSIALTLFTSLIVPQTIRSVDPIFQVRATELAQSLINEISSKPFDENSSRTGARERCNEGATVCTSSDQLGYDGSENRANYDDVDDYHNLSEVGAIQNSLGNAIEIAGDSLYAGFQANVTVFYDDNRNGVDESIDTGGSFTGNTKLITVTITTPNNEAINFSTYRSNY